MKNNVLEFAKYNEYCAEKGIKADRISSLDSYNKSNFKPEVV